MSDSDPFAEAADQLVKLQKNPEKFLSPPKEWHPTWLDITKKLYDSWISIASRKPVSRDSEDDDEEEETEDGEVTSRRVTGYLERLAVDGFDDEQVWQQLELASRTKMGEGTSSSSTASSSSGYLDGVARVVARSDRAILPSSVGKTKKSVRFGPAEEEDWSGEDEDEDGAEDEDEDEETAEGDSDASDLGLGSEDEGEEEDEEEEDAGRKKGSKSASLTKPIVPTEVDDKFFKLTQAEEYLDLQDKLEERRMNGERVDEDDDKIDYFQDVPSDDEEPAGDAKYEDFFDPPPDVEPPSSAKTKSKKKKKTEEQDDDEEEDDEAEGEDEAEEEEDEGEQGEETGPKSSFEVRQERLKERIRKLEEENVGEKPWQMKGESHAGARPANALLEEFLTYENVAKSAPIITEEVSRTLQDIIKQRIKDKSWDDVERKSKPVKDPYEYKKQLVLDQEKSKLSLAEVYEKEYLKMRDGPAVDGGAEPAEKPEHAEIRQGMEALFRKLDALSNFHFAPKPVQPELKIVSNQPAVTVEEVAPVFVSDASLLAPKEVQANQKGDLMSKEERSETDKKRERRKKKKLQREKFKRQEERNKLRGETANPRSLAKLEKQEALKKIKSGGKGVVVSIMDKHGRKGGEKTIRSSKKFFDRLQDEVSKGIQSGKKRPVAADDAKTKLNVKRLKL